MTLVTQNDRLRTKGLFPKTSVFDEFYMPELEEDFGASWVPAANIREDEKEFIVELSIPGYSRDEIVVDVDNNNLLRIMAEHKEESSEETESYVRREFRQGGFTRKFRLPETVESDKVSAKYVDGLLKVDIPKKKTAVLKAKSKQVKIG